MGRRSHSRRLGLWMNGEEVGTWIWEPGGMHTLVYAESWAQSRFARPISLSLPLVPRGGRHRGPVVESYFDHLLPDNLEIRRRFQTRFGVPSIQAFDLLSEIGRDCVGALQILPEGRQPESVQSIQSQALKAGEVAEVLRQSTAGAVLGQALPEEFRLSLAGAQEKTAFLKRGGKWHRPLGSTPTTHIFKFPMGRSLGRDQIDMSASVENEWLCSRILAALGLPCASCEVAEFEDQKVLVVERFDRALAADGSWWHRLPQEDMCQALGVPMGIKYESEGAPGMAELAKLLLGSEAAEADRLRFFKTQIVFWMLAAIDGHARNFSVFLGRGGSFRLTPLYDVISAYPILGHGKHRLPPEKVKMALSVRGRQGGKQYLWDRITPRHWVDTAAMLGLEPRIGPLLSELRDTVPSALNQVRDALPKTFPASVAEPIIKGAKKAMKSLSNES